MVIKKTKKYIDAYEEDLIMGKVPYFADILTQDFDIIKIMLVI